MRGVTERDLLRLDREPLQSQRMPPVPGRPHLRSVVLDHERNTEVASEQRAGEIPDRDPVVDKGVVLASRAQEVIP